VLSVVALEGARPATLAEQAAASKPVSEPFRKSDAKDLIRKAVKAAVTSAEQSVRADVKSDVTDAVKTAISETMANKFTGVGELRQAEVPVAQASMRFQAKLVHNLHAAASAAAAKEEGEVKTEMSHIAQELDNQLGSIVSDDQAPIDSSAAVQAVAAAASASRPTSHKEWENLAKKMLFSQEQADKDAQAQQRAAAAHSAQTKETKEQAEESKMLQSEDKHLKRETQAVQDGGSEDANAPITSHRNPQYVQSEHSRDSLAERDFKSLQAKLHPKRARAQQSAGADTQDDSQEKQPADSAVTDEEKQLKARDADAKKYLAKALSNRNEQAEDDLKQLDSKGKLPAAKPAEPAPAADADAAKKAAVPVTSHLNPQYVDAEHLRDEQAKQDLALLKKGVAEVRHGASVEQVKIAAAARSSSKLAADRAYLRAHAPPTGPDRNALAAKYLKQLQAAASTAKAAKPAPAAPAGKDLSAKAQADLKLMSSTPREQQSPSSDRDIVAMADLSLLPKLAKSEAKPATAPTPVSRAAIADHDLALLAKSKPAATHAAHAAHAAHKAAAAHKAGGK
jgi:hypothetical protein